MIRLHRCTRRILPLGFMLVMLLFLGHVCDIPAFAELLAHDHETGQQSPGHHPNAGEESCEAVAGVLSAASVHLDLSPTLDGTGTPPVVSVGPVPAGAAAAHDPPGSPRRLPLFLLHASLLI